MWDTSFASSSSDAGRLRPHLSEDKEIRVKVSASVRAGGGAPAPVGFDGRVRQEGGRMRRMIPIGATLVVLVSAGDAVRALDQGPIAFWSREDLVGGRAPNLPLVTASHAYGLLRLQPSA